MVERVDRRILGALRPVDAVTGAPVLHGLRISGQGITLQRTRSGAYAITAAEGLGAHVAAFAAPPGPPPAAGALPFVIEIEDPTERFLPRSATIALPRRWDPAGGIRELMEPILLPLAPAASRAAAPGWAVVEARVTEPGGAPIRGALVEVMPAGGGARLAWGLTHARGEALVAVPGLPAFRTVVNDPADEADDEIVTAATSVTLRVTADPSRPWPVDPTRLEAGGGTLRRVTTAALNITPGQAIRAPVTLNLS